jgi:hypothetical protein
MLLVLQELRLATSFLQSNAMIIFFEGIGFLKEWVASKTFEEFKGHEGHHGLSDDQLKEVYDLAIDKQPGGKAKKENK